MQSPDHGGGGSSLRGSSRLLPPAPVEGSRGKRALWYLVQLLLFRPSPAPFFAWRSFLLRLFGARIAPEARVYPSARIWAPWNLRMEAGACLAWGVDCYCVAPITLRRRALVSQYARLLTATHDLKAPGFRLMAAPIELEEDSWVCAYAYVGPGVKLGPGAVVAATATAVHDVDSWTVVGGNPARFLKQRPRP